MRVLQNQPDYLDYETKNMTTVGKFRHLSRTTTENGHFVITAIDHRTNLLEKLNQYVATPLSNEVFTQFKQDVIGTLAPHSSGILTDPAYGIGRGITSGTLSRDIGLLAPIEVTDYDLHPAQRSVEMIPGWSVKKIKLVGGDGVKLLLPYNPGAKNIEEKYDFVRQIVADCATYDIPFFLEPIPYALNPDDTLSNQELLEISINMCETFSAMGVDILKLPFPLDHKQSTNEDEWLSACNTINEACTVPWALLSAGVNFETFLKQSKIACQAGASGVIVGRAVWAEAVELQGDERHDFLLNVAVKRMQELADVCSKYATAWHQHIEKPDTTFNWYESYQS